MTLNSVRNIIRQHILKEGPRIFAYKLWKHSRLYWLKKTGYWSKLSRHVTEFWSEDRIAIWLDLARRDKFLIGPSKLETFVKWTEKQSNWVETTKAQAENTRQGRFTIFDQLYQFDINDLPWHTDWRWDYTWEPNYYRNYTLYLPNKDVSYDVKFPWELSRFSFLLQLAQTVSITNQTEWYDLIMFIVTDWEKKNPVAYSINWAPMETAMRGLALVLTIQMLGANQTTQPNHIATILRQVSLHGEFLFRNIEYTRSRGNHYTANIISLLLMGLTLQQIYPQATHWTRYAGRCIFEELDSQYYKDGINFEKSISYHRLVTELFLLGLFAMEHEGYVTPPYIKEKIYRACEYIHFYTRPDGLAANFGDNDSARLLSFDSLPLRDHRYLLALAASYFSDETFKSSAQHSSATIPWLLGNPGTETWDSLRDTSDQFDTRFFERGGMFVVKGVKNHLISDFGEVGMNGVGGHGHNDTFSFELCLNGQPIIIDTGCPVYTGDLDMYNKYRSTEYHNTVRVDGKEMARLLATWRISNEAEPTNVQFEPGSEVDIIKGEHRGYNRLDNSVTHRRTLIFYKFSGRLICQDQILCSGAHHAEQFLYFSPNVGRPVLKGQGATTCLSTGKTVYIKWQPQASPRLEKVQISDNYGHLTNTWRLALSYEISGKTDVKFEIGLQKPIL